MIPRDKLRSLTAEDLALLLNGSPKIDIALLQRVTVFADESGTPDGSVVLRSAVCLALTACACLELANLA